jgi:hypothetical protein
MWADIAGFSMSENKKGPAMKPGPVWSGGADYSAA